MKSEYGHDEDPGTRSGDVIRYKLKPRCNKALYCLDLAIKHPYFKYTHNRRSMYESQLYKK